MKNFINTTKRDNVIFGLIFFILFLIIGLYPLKSDGIIRIWAVILSLIFFITTIIRPALFTFFNIFWIQFGILIGKIISPIVMGLIFYFIVTPIGIFLRILNKDIMSLKIEEKKSSYWINRQEKIQTMKKQF